MVNKNNEQGFLADMDLYMNQGLSAAVIMFLRRHNLPATGKNGHISPAYIFSEAVAFEFSQEYDLNDEDMKEAFPFEGSLRENIMTQLKEQAGGYEVLQRLWASENRDMLGPLVRTITCGETLRFLDEQKDTAIKAYRDLVEENA